MKKPRANQFGGSTLSNLFTLALLAYGGYVAYQYVPLVLESRNIDTTLNSLLRAHEFNPVTNESVAEDRLHNMLNMSEMQDMARMFSIRRNGGFIIVAANYERELNLVFTNKTLHYEKSVTLR